ncbi:unnamed protein product [Prunus armeniaca]
MDEIAKVGFAKTIFESSVSSLIIYPWASRILVAEAGGMLSKGLDYELVKEGLLQGVEGVDSARIQPIEPVQSSATEDKRENETHIFVTEALGSEGRLKRVDMGEGILLARVKGSAERLNVLLLTIVEDTFSEGARAWLHLKGLIAVALLTLKTSDFLKEEPHGRVGMRENTEC